ncbi:hypothetical protein H2198_007289, partial [Neophaeococcomyces mojaviensis]
MSTQPLSTPRILPKHLSQFAPSAHPSITTIRTLGTITSIHGETATLTSGDGETVTLLLNRDSHLSPQGLYEVVGKVVNLEGGNGYGIKVMATTEWKNANGSKVDLAAFDAVVDATHRYKELFYGTKD